MTSSQISSIAFGVLYGLIARGVTGNRWSGGNWFFGMTLAFLVVVPLVIGALTAWPVRDATSRGARPYGWAAAILVLVIVTVAVGVYPPILAKLGDVAILTRLAF